MKNVLIIFILALLFAGPSGAQNFTFQGNSPFGIQTISGMLSTQRLMFFDDDGDGDLDLYLSGMGPIADLDDLTWETMPYFIDYQENIGDKSNPQFGPRVPAFNGNFPFPAGFFFPSVGDLNNDSRVDFVINSHVDYIGNRTPVYYKNLNHQGIDDFDLIHLTDMNLPDFLPESFFIPELIDLDHDGDLDLLMSGFDPAFAEEDGPDVPAYYYAKNTGTVQAPAFLGWFENPYGLIPNPLVEVTASGDIDNDGDTDILGALSIVPEDSMNFIYFHNNVPGPNGKPAFSTVTNSPFGLPQSFGKNQFLSPTLVDIDGDGDLDFFVLQGTTANNELKYFENNLCTSVVNQTGVELCDGDSLVIGGITYNEPGDYVLTLAGPNGCDTTLYLTISTIPVYSTSLTESICDGETYIVGTEPFDTPGNYIVTLIASNGCDSVITLNLSVIQVDNSVSVLENTLTANQPGATYQWINCDIGESIPGATDQNYTATTSGNYAVEITDNFGCFVASSCISVIINGLEENLLSEDISIYPNPSNGWINIKNDTHFEISAIAITNLSGQIQGNIVLNSNHIADISFLGKGLYLMKININGLVVVKKLIVM